VWSPNGPSRAKFVEIHIAFEHDFAGRGNFQVNRFTFHEFDRRSAQEAGDQIFLDLRGRGNNGRKRHCGFGADRDGNFHFAGRPAAFGDHRSARRPRHDVDGRGLSLNRCAHALASMFRRIFLALPVHSRGALVIDLHAVHSKIALARPGVARGDAGQGDESSAILRPALQDRKIEQGKIVALDHFFARPGRHRARKKFAQLRSAAEAF
jgi:hypothetical protein